MRVIYTIPTSWQHSECITEAGGSHTLVSYFILRKHRQDFLEKLSLDGAVYPKKLTTGDRNGSQS